MKKNLFLKLASGLLVLCLASTCAIGTTFAKYVTGDKASDTARVAHWGITVALSGTLFGTDYAATTADTIVATSQNVDSSNTDNIVAPGTKNDIGFQVKLTGTPEVQYEVTAGLNSVDIEDIFLGAGEWGVMVPVYGVNDATDISKLYTETGGVYTLNGSTAYVAGKTYYALHDYVNLTDAYYPISWNVAKAGADATYTVTDERNLTTIATDLKDAIDGLTGIANNALDVTYTLTWNWAFDDTDNVYSNDGADTILGNLMANDTTNKVVKMSGTTYTSALVDGVDYNLEIKFGLNVTVEQVD